MAKKQEVQKQAKDVPVATKSKKILKVKKTDDKTFKKKKMASRFNKLRLKGDDSSRVVYVGHLPKGFEEDELKQFFAQFGNVKKVKLARSKKTGRAKGYSFI